MEWYKYPVLCNSLILILNHVSVKAMDNPTNLPSNYGATSHGSTSTAGYPSISDIYSRPTSFASFVPGSAAITTKWVEYDRTEMIKDELNPEFVKKIRMTYKFEEQQLLMFVIYDIDSESTNLTKHDFLGFATTALAKILSEGKGRIELDLFMKTKNEPPKRAQGVIIIAAEEMTDNNDLVTLQLTGVDIIKKNWLGIISKSNSFVNIYKSTEHNDYVLVYQTEVTKSFSKPRFKPFTIPIKTLCNGDYDRNLKFVIHTWAWRRTYLTVIGHSPCCTLQRRYFIDNKPKYRNSGYINVEYIEIIKVHSFMDYVMGGIQIHCTVAIDFTASNGSPWDTNSLHYINPQGIMNEYEQAIISVVSIIEDYDSDKMFPVIGFGARLPPSNQISHSFFVNMSDSPFCFGVGGVSDAYRHCIHQVQLSRPTNFAPIVRHVMDFAKNYQDGNNYFILLLLTDGIITDKEQTTRAIVQASRLPMSIIIVGVGNANFSDMGDLDADTAQLRDPEGIVAQRDIVQFVPFRKFLGDADPRRTKFQLAKEVLAEVPKQLISYMQSHNFKPHPPIRDVHSNLPPNPDLL